VKVNFKIEREGVLLSIQGKLGSTIKDLVEENDELKPHLECACDGRAACSTCHVIVDEAFYNILPPADESEQDMIDLAWGVTERSRLGCQLVLDENCDGMILTVPEQSNNLL
jgi:ferredoxin, 2Fe-2S